MEAQVFQGFNLDALKCALLIFHIEVQMGKYQSQLDRLLDFYLSSEFEKTSNYPTS